MRKRIIKSLQSPTASTDHSWLNIEQLVDVEISSEDAAHPIESALLDNNISGWRASTQGKQTLRILFNQPQQLQRIWLNFIETQLERTQEYVLRYSSNRGQTFQEIVRQQWNFNPQGSTCETEDHQVNLPEVTELELEIIPDIGGKNVFASLEQLRLA